MKTKYYFYRTNAANGIIAVCGNEACEITTTNGFYEGVDIYTSTAIKDLQNIFKQKAQFIYDFEDIKRDFPDRIISFNEDDFELLEIILEK